MLGYFPLDRHRATRGRSHNWRRYGTFRGDSAGTRTQNQWIKSCAESRPSLSSQVHTGYHAEAADRITIPHWSLAIVKCLPQFRNKMGSSQGSKPTEVLGFIIVVSAIVSPILRNVVSVRLGQAEDTSQYQSLPHQAKTGSCRRSSMISNSSRSSVKSKTI